MPLYKTITVSPSTTVYIWKIEEDLDRLSQKFKQPHKVALNLTQNSLDRLSNMKSELHQRGFLSIRHLLAEAGYTDFDLYYSEHI